MKSCAYSGRKARKQMVAEGSEKREPPKHHRSSGGREFGEKDGSSVRRG